jgi:hypothetical protein
MISISHRRADGHLTIIVAEAGDGRYTKTIKSMTQTSNLSLANRKQLADMLGNLYGGLRQKARDRFRHKEQTLKVALVKEYAEKKGALKAVVQIDAAQSKIQELKRELAVLGFQLDSDGLDLSRGSSDTLRKLINERIERELGTEDALEARFDSAQIAMMTVASLEDAEKLLKSVSEI